MFEAEAYTERVWSSNGTANRVIRRPSGPVVVITPWNAPFMLSTWKCAPALAAGNTVILKPAEWSPLSCSLMADLADQAGIPPGVFNVVQGIGEEVGAALVADPRVRRISFTGSPGTARHIGIAAAANIVPFTAELGGKGPFIVFDDADIDAAARKAAGQFDDSGQVCLAGTRLIVQDTIRDVFLERFHHYTDRHVLGDSHDPTTTISPMIHPDHLANVADFVERARSAGDTIVRGGKVWREGGLWYQPTLIEPRNNDSEVVQHEVFGPVLTFQTFTTDAEAIRLANSTPYGFRRSSTHPHRRGRSTPGATFAPGRSGPTAFSSATSPPRSAAAGSPVSAAKAATTPSTSTATSSPSRSPTTPPDSRVIAVGVTTDTQYDMVPNIPVSTRGRSWKQPGP
jgi:acyl-CoA reductase-like NAD-dependent aldehyde dehydrogenase